MIYELINALHDFNNGGFEIILCVCCPACRCPVQIKQFGEGSEFVYFNEVQRICECGHGFVTTLKLMTGKEWFLEWVNSDKGQRQQGRILSLLPDGEYIDTECLECFKEDMKKGERKGGSKCKSKKEEVKRGRIDPFYVQ